MPVASARVAGERGEQRERRRHERQAGDREALVAAGARDARPDSVVETVMPSIAGTSSRPASVGLAPVVVCRNSGTKTVTANSAAVPRNSAALATATTRVRSSANGTIGSAARRSRARARRTRTTRRGDQREDRGRAPGVAVAAPDAGQHERAGRARPAARRRRRRAGAPGAGAPAGRRRCRPASATTPSGRLT